LIWIKGGEKSDKTVVLRCSEAHDRASGAGIICVEHHKSGCRQDSQWREHAMEVYRDTSFIQFTPSAVANSVAPSLNIETQRIGSDCCACVNRWPVIGGDANPSPAMPARRRRSSLTHDPDSTRRAPFTITGVGVTARGDGKVGILQIRLADPLTNNLRDGLGACTGDSGAPAFEMQAGSAVITGVVSWSTARKTPTAAAASPASTH
jgi:hypothetical protein